MSDVDVVRAAFSAWREEVDDGTAFDFHFHPEVEYREDPEWPGASTYVGLDRVKECFRAYQEILEFDSAEVEQAKEAGDSVVVIVRVRVRVQAAAEPVEHRWGYLCRVRDGKVAFFQAYVDPNAALAAAASP